MLARDFHTPNDIFFAWKKRISEQSISRNGINVRQVAIASGRLLLKSKPAVSSGHYGSIYVIADSVKEVCMYDASVCYRNYSTLGLHRRLREEPRSKSIAFLTENPVVFHVKKRTKFVESTHHNRTRITEQVRTADRCSEFRTGSEIGTSSCFVSTPLSSSRLHPKLTRNTRVLFSILEFIWVRSHGKLTILLCDWSFDCQVWTSLFCRLELKANFTLVEWRWNTKMVGQSVICAAPSGVSWPGKL